MGGVSLYMMKGHYQEFSKQGAKGLAEAVGEETHAKLSQLATCNVRNRHGCEHQHHCMPSMESVGTQRCPLKIALQQLQVHKGPLASKAISPAARLHPYK